MWIEAQALENLLSDDDLLCLGTRNRFEQGAKADRSSRNSAMWPPTRHNSLCRQPFYELSLEIFRLCQDYNCWRYAAYLGPTRLCSLNAQRTDARTCNTRKYQVYLRMMPALSSRCPAAFCRGLSVTRSGCALRMGERGRGEPLTIWEILDIGKDAVGTVPSSRDVGATFKSLQVLP